MKTKEKIKITTVLAELLLRTLYLPYTSNKTVSSIPPQSHATSPSKGKVYISGELFNF
jgi:hypothetical protein